MNVSLVFDHLKRTIYKTTCLHVVMPLLRLHLGQRQQGAGSHHPGEATGFQHPHSHGGIGQLGQSRPAAGRFFDAPRGRLAAPDAAGLSHQLHCCRGQQQSHQAAAAGGHRSAQGAKVPNEETAEEVVAQKHQKRPEKRPTATLEIVHNVHGIHPKNNKYINIYIYILSGNVKTGFRDVLNS